MVVHKRKKDTRMRGKTTHGGGSKKKRRGKGSHGGKGMAGTGKRAGHKKIKILQIYGHKYFGRSGFKRPQKTLKKIVAVNLDYLDSHLDIYAKKKLVSVDGDFYVIDAAKLNIDKILGGGEINHKIKIRAQSISRSAVEKIKKAGGIVEDNVLGK